MILTQCFGFCRPEGKHYPKSAKIVGLYVNMDVSIITGITRVKDIGLASTGPMEALVISYLHEGSTHFTPRSERGGVTIHSEFSSDKDCCVSALVPRVHSVGEVLQGGIL